MASCQAVITGENSTSWAAQQAGVLLVVGAPRRSAGMTRPAAPSCRVPLGSPSGVALDPAVGRVGRARRRCRRGSSASVLTQAPWPSRLGRRTGRSGTTASSSSHVGVPPGKASIDQPPPVIHSAVGVRRRRRPRSARRYSSADFVPCSSQRTRSTPAITGWTCASWKPGSRSPPARSTTSVPGPASASTSAPPTATMRSPDTATVPGTELPAPGLNSAPPVKILSAD